MVTNGDKEEGVKNWDFYGDILFEWPLKVFAILYLLSDRRLSYKKRVYALFYKKVVYKKVHTCS